MKKLKMLLSIVTICVLAFCLAGCGDALMLNCGGEEQEYRLESIEVKNAQTQFYLGEEFTTEGLEVTAVMENLTQNKTEYDIPVPVSDLVIDSSEYNKDEVGEYTIVVSYTYAGVTEEAEYDVTVDKPVRLARIFVDTENAKKIYDMDEDFSSEGLTVTAVDRNFQLGYDLESYDVTKDVTINSSSFKKGGD